MNARRAEALDQTVELARALPAGSAQSTQARTPLSVLKAGPHPVHSRRLLLKAAMASLGVLAIWLMDRVAKRSESLPENSEITVSVPWNAAHGVHFYDRLIVVNNAAGVAVFSSLCPHLGCRIKRTEGTELVCPCHGSRFNQQGEFVHGPAKHGLRPLPFALDRKNSVLGVTLES